jgi:predicted alpha/beta-fold hydrolase
VILQSSFKPAWWLNNPHLQTLYALLCRKIAQRPEIKRERLTTPDGDFIDVDHCGSASAPIVILLHGLTGSSESIYIQGLQTVLMQQGFRSVALNFRGCSGVANLSSRCYHSGETGDIDFLYQTLRQREPDTSLAVVGFSLGGNVLLKWLGEKQQSLSLFAAVAVSVPLQLAICATKLDQGFSKLYRAYLLRELKIYMRRKQYYLQQINALNELKILNELGDLAKIHSFWQYDDRVVAKLYAFNDVEDYYQRSSSRAFLKTIAVPSLLIHALDDPFMTPAVVPQADELSPLVQLELAQAGGHVGFISGDQPLKPQYWLEQRIPEFLHQHCLR